MLLSNSTYNNLSPRDTNDVNNINDFLEKEKKTPAHSLIIFNTSKNSYEPFILPQEFRQMS